MKTIIASPKAPKAVGPYSQAVKCGDTLYISGQLPIDGATGAMPESIEDQTRQSLTNLGDILRSRIYPHIMHSPFQKIRKARPKALQPRLTNGPARYFAATASISTSAPIGKGQQEAHRSAAAAASASFGRIFM